MYTSLSYFSHGLQIILVVMTVFLHPVFQCEFLDEEAQDPNVISPSSLRVAASDLQQLMVTFSHVFETDMRAYCGRDPPNFSSETDVFRRVHQLLQAFITVPTHLLKTSAVLLSKTCKNLSKQIFRNKSY